MEPICSWISDKNVMNAFIVLGTFIIVIALLNYLFLLVTFYKYFIYFLVWLCSLVGILKIGFFRLRNRNFKISFFVIRVDPIDLRR